MKPRIILALGLLFLLLLLGCSGGKNSPGVTEPGIAEKSADAGKSSIGLLGFYTFRINSVTGETEIIPHRVAEGVLNGMQYFEPPVNTNITITPGSLQVDAAAQTVEVDLNLHHPLANTRYTGFELRGVVFGPRVVNADGETRWMNPVEFDGLPWGYGNFSMGTGYNGANFQRLHNGYKLFMKDYENPYRIADTQNGPAPTGPYDAENTSFAPGDVFESHYLLQWDPTTDPWLVFQFGIIANWANPAGAGPFTPSDFPPNAHCPEPFLVQATVYDNNLFHTPSNFGNDFSLAVKVYDMRGPGANNVFIESAELGLPPTPFTNALPGDLAFEFNYVFENISIPAPLPPGNYPLLISVVDPMTYGQAYMASAMPPTHPLYAVNIQTQIETEITISPEPFDIFRDQVGYLTWDPVLGGDGRALLSVIFDGRASEGVSVDLDTGPFGLGILNAPAVKGEGGFQFVIDNSAGLETGIYSLNILIYTLEGLIEALFDVEIIAVEEVPDPIYTHDITYSGNTIGSVEVGTFTASDCGVNIEKTFTPNEEDTDCDEYRWIQVISTDTPISANAPNSYVDPYGNDDPPGDHEDDPYYWTEDEADGQNNAGEGEPRNPDFSDRPRRPPPPADKEPLWWHAELVLVCVRWGEPDVLLHSEHYYFFKDADGTVHEGHYDGTDGGSDLFRDTLENDFPDYDFE